MENERPILTAVSSSARQLYLLLRCINFASKAHVQISDEGLKFSVDEASVMEGSAFLSKSLFTSYSFRAPPAVQTAPDPDSDNEVPDDSQSITAPAFQISLPSLLETLQILGLTDPNTQKPPWARSDPTSTAFSNNVLGMNNLCRIAYAAVGSPLVIIITEASIRTTCELTTYEPAFAEEIPFDRGNLAFKTIMRGSWLSDAISELSSTTPEKLTLWARTSARGKPYFALSSSGTLGSTRVEFNNDGSSAPVAPSRTSTTTTVAAMTTNLADAPPQQGTAQTNLLETFQLASSPLSASYKFSLIQRASRAMSVASKVSIRVDEQGVLSLQFMIEVDSSGNGGGASGGGGSGVGNVSFVDFRIVPLIEEDEDDDGEESSGDDGEGDGMGEGDDDAGEDRSDRGL